MYTSKECERKLNDLEKIHADMGKMCKFHKDSCPIWEFFFSFHECYNETTLN